MCTMLRGWQNHQKHIKRMCCKLLAKLYIYYKWTLLVSIPEILDFFLRRTVATKGGQQSHSKVVVAADVELADCGKGKNIDMNEGWPMAARGTEPSPIVLLWTWQWTTVDAEAARTEQLNLRLHRLQRQGYPEVMTGRRAWTICLASALEEPEQNLHAEQSHDFYPVLARPAALERCGWTWIRTHRSWQMCVLWTAGSHFGHFFVHLLLVESISCCSKCFFFCWPLTAAMHGKGWCPKPQYVWRFS